MSLVFVVICFLELATSYKMETMTKDNIKVMIQDASAITTTYMSTESLNSQAEMDGIVQDLIQETGTRRG